MAILDSKGRLFGKVSLLDLGAGLILLMVVAGLFLLPGGTGSSVAQIGAANKPVEMDVIVRGLTVSNPKAFVEAIQQRGNVPKNEKAPKPDAGQQKTFGKGKGKGKGKGRGRNLKKNSPGRNVKKKRMSPPDEALPMFAESSAPTGADTGADKGLTHPNKNRRSIKLCPGGSPDHGTTCFKYRI